MKSIKRVLKISVLILAITTLTVGCAKKDENVGEKGKNVSLRMSWWGNDDRHAATLDAIKEYSKENENIKVSSEYNGYNSYQEKITTQLAGNTEADIMQINYDWFPTFSRKGDGFYDLYELIDVLDISQYDTEFLKLGEIDGKLNGLPFSQNTMTLAINESVYESLGIEIPETWEDFVEAAKKFPKGSYPIVASNPMFILNIYLQQKTGKTILTTSNELNYTASDYKEAFKWYKGLIDAGVFCNREDYLENVGSEYTSLAQNAKFIEGKYAGIIDWSGSLDSYESTLKEMNQNLVVVPMPQIKGSKVNGTISKPAVFFSISKNTKNPKEAAKLLDFLVNDPTSINILGLTRGIPSSKIAVETLDKEGKLTGIAKSAFDYGESVESLAGAPSAENRTIQTAYEQNMENFELGQSDLDQASNEIFNQLSEFVKTLN